MPLGDEKGQVPGIETEDLRSAVEVELRVGLAEKAGGRTQWLNGSTGVPGEDESTLESGVDTGGAAPAVHRASRGSNELADGAAVDVDGTDAVSLTESWSFVQGRKPRSRLEARGGHELLPLGAVRADLPSVELAHGEVGHFVAEDFLEESVGSTFELGGDANEAAVGVAAAEAPGET